jgi:hypothetical protein
MLYVNNVILFGVGTTQLPFPSLKSKIAMVYSKYFWSKILNKEFSHAVRDKESVNLLNMLGLKNVKNLGCPSMWKLTREHARNIPKDKSDAVITTLNSKYPSRDDFLLIKILSEKYREIYFWAQGYTDICYVKKIVQNIRIPVKLIPPSLRAYDKFLNTHVVDYVGLRVHAGIRALQYKKRTLIIAIDKRAISWSKDFGLPVIPRPEVNMLRDIIDQPIDVRLRVPESEIKEFLINFRKYVVENDRK